MSDSPSLAQRPTEQDYPEFTLEYLGVLDLDGSFEESLRSFCETFSLSVEEQTSDFIAAAGNDFELRAAPISSSTAYSGKAILISIFAESEYDLETAKEIIDEYTSGDIFDDLVLLRDSLGEWRTQRAYQLLNELENALRKLVAARAASIAGPEWWSEVVQRGAFTRGDEYKYERYRAQELGDQDITRHSDLDHHALFYLDLSEIKAIVGDEENWKNGFVDDLKVLRNIERLDFLNRLRRRIAHNRFLSRSNFDDLKRLHDHLMHLCRRAMGDL